MPSSKARGSGTKNFRVGTKIERRHLLIWERGLLASSPRQLAGDKILPSAGPYESFSASCRKVQAASLRSPKKTRKTPAGQSQRAFLLPKPIYGLVVVVVVVSFFSIIALAGLLITTLRTIIRLPSFT
jgi:hypothetical protein